MTPNRPYLLRAFYEWIVDNDCTPHILVDTEMPGVVVPTQFIKDNQIVLNIAPGATASLHMDNDWVSFNARFGGQPMQVSVPVSSIVAIYARENGAGTVFEQSEPVQEGTAPVQPPAPENQNGPEDKPPKGSHLKVIK